ncbi:hypothetical protein [Parasedimentitalea huanghaiensis]|uniref:hypothetical protein n=1 Tax=Parasedimentitalea huanghaiensis TaxID=2682100 RepID=UPI00142F414F|nr:hypothetical protein [Zongyanglinia huanghaiensis]
MNKLKSFLASDDGAVTVDWVVLTAGIVGLCSVIASTIFDGGVGLANAVVAYMSNWNLG